MSSTSDGQDDRKGLDGDSLNHVSVLNDQDLSFGMPTQLFWGGVIMSVVFLYVLPWYFAVLVAGIFFTAMFTIHKDDPGAFDAWMKVIKPGRIERRSGGSHKPRNVYFIDKKD